MLEDMPRPTITEPASEVRVPATAAGGAASIIESVPPMSVWLRPDLTTRADAEAVLQTAAPAPGTLAYLVRPRAGAVPGHAFSFIAANGKFVHRLLEQPVAGGPFSLKGKPRPWLGTRLEVAVPRLVADTCSKFGFERAAPVLRKDTSDV